MVAPMSALAQDPGPRTAGSDRGPALEREPERLDPVDQDRGPVAAPAPVSTLAPELTLPESPEVARARSLLGVRRYAEAALIFEAQAAKSVPPDRRFLYHASLARAQAGQHGHAAEHLRIILRSGALPPPLHQELTALMEASCGKASRVRVQVSESTSAEVVTSSELERGTLSLELPSTVAGEGPTRWKLALGSGEVCLDPGAYMVDLELPGYYPLRLRRVVDAGAQAQSWDFAVEPHKVLVDLRVLPEKALRRGRGSLRLRRIDRAGGVPLVFEAIEPTTTVALPVGTWSAEAKARRYSGQRTITVVPSSQSADISMNKRKSDGAKFSRPPRKSAGPIAGYFAVNYAGGVGLLLGGTFGQSDRESEYEDFLTEAGVDPDDGAPLSPEIVEAAEAAIPTAEYHRGLRVDTRLQTAGVTMAMHSLGFIVSTLPMLTAGKKRSSYIILGVGGAVLAGGAGWMAVYASKERALLGSDLPEDRVGVNELSGLIGHRLGAGMLTGFGSGMVIGSALILTLDRLKRRRNLAAAPMSRPVIGPVIGRGLGGLSLQGRF